MGQLHLHRHITAFTLASQCAQLGAHIGTTACVSGLGYTVLRRFLYDASSAHRGRGSSSVLCWYEAANSVQKADACLFAAIFMHLCERNPFTTQYTPGHALIDSFRLYRQRCHRPPLVSLDRAFLLACHLKGIWLQRTPSLLLRTCIGCGSQYLAHCQDLIRRDAQCIFCQLVKLYPRDPRIRRQFPRSPLPAGQHPLDAGPVAFGLPYSGQA